MKKIIIGILSILVIAGLIFLFTNDKKIDNKNMDDSQTSNEIVNIVFNTNMGNIELELYKGKTPKTVENFTGLAAQGFYDQTKFHRVIENFMIQGGDPLSKDDNLKDAWGTGSPGYQFEDEIVEDLKNEKGTISMANSGPNTNGSQFFINVNDNTHLDGKHSVFGRVTGGYEIVEQISITETGDRDVPANPIVIQSITISG